MKRILLLLFVLFLGNFVFCLTPNFSEVNYSGQVIDVGISNYNPLTKTVSISIYSAYENYFERIFLISETDYIPVILDSQIDSDTKIKYKLYDINNVLLEEKEFLLNLEIYSDLPNFYLCKKADCSEFEIPENYDFWIDEDVFVISDKFNADFKYNIIIMDNKKNEIFSETEINFPYLINTNSISGHKNYNLMIEIINKNINLKFINSSVDFTLEDTTKERHEEIINDIQNPSLEENIIIEEKEEQIVRTDKAPLKDLNTTTELINPEKGKNNLYIFLLIILILIILVAVIPKKQKRRLNRNY